MLVGVTVGVTVLVVVTLGVGVLVVVTLGVGVLVDVCVSVGVLVVVTLGVGVFVSVGVLVAVTLGVVLLVSVLVMPVWLEYQTVNALTEKVRVIEKDAKKIKSLQAEMDAIINESQKLLDEKNAVPMVVGMLDSLSTIIKDDTWLAYLQYSDNHLQIQGESPAASTLIGILEASDFFTNARFVSPVTQNNVSKLERFQITVDSKKTGRVDDNP